MLKKYNSKKNGFWENIFGKSTIMKCYTINNKRHGHYYYWCGSEKSIWSQGLYYNDEEYGHWLENYNVYKFYL